MEKRKAYIITALIVVILLTVLSGWYVYLVKQEGKIGEVTNIGYGDNGDRSGLLNRGTDGGGFGTQQGSGDGTINFNNNEYSTSGGSDREGQNGQGGELIVGDTFTLGEHPEVWSLVQISASETAGSSIRGSGTSTVVEFSERKNGHIQEYSVDTTQKSRLSGVTLPRVVNSIILNPSEMLVLRRDADGTQVLELVQTLQGASDSTQILIEREVLEVVSAPGLTKAYYSVKNITGGIDVLSYDTLSGETTGIWGSPLSNWTMQYIPNLGGSIIFTQYASNTIPGYAYILGLGSGVLQSIVQDKPGLMVNVSPDGGQALYSTHSGNTSTLVLKNIIENTEVELSIATLASKCAWSSDSVLFYCGIPSTLPAGLPDSWLKGVARLSDALWRVNSQTGDALELSPQSGLDIIDIVEGDGVVVFKNKRDQSLWSVVRE